PGLSEADALVAQLAVLGDTDGAPVLTPAEVAAAAAAVRKGELPTGENGEPINRGLLLKFLSSVRGTQ
ncbi:MAG: hypothetical protein ACRD0F_10275, partial [Acidimicrobiales bacterium]